MSLALSNTFDPAAIILQLRRAIPTFVDLFSNTVDVSSVHLVDNIATITTVNPHTFGVGQEINVFNALVSNPITDISVESSSLLITTAYDHSLTAYSFTEKNKYGNEVQYYDPSQEYIALDGFTDSSLNAYHQLIDGASAIPSSKQVRIIKPDGIASITLNGSEILLEDRSLGLNDLWTISEIVDEYNFKVDMTKESIDFLTDIPSMPNQIVSTFKNFNVVTSRIDLFPTVDSFVNFYTSGMGAMLGVVVSGVSASPSLESLYTGAQPGLKQGVQTNAMFNYSVIALLPTNSELVAKESLLNAHRRVFPAIFGSLAGVILPFPSQDKISPNIQSHAFLGFNQIGYTGSMLLYKYDFRLTFELSNSFNVDTYKTVPLRSVSITSDVKKDIEDTSASRFVDLFFN